VAGTLFELYSKMSRDDVSVAVENPSEKRGIEPVQALSEESGEIRSRAVRAKSIRLFVLQN
jgi:hypothetical protein